MKQTKHLLLLAALLHCIATNAHDFEADGIYYNIISFTEETVEVTYQGEQYDSYDEYNGTVIIPETVAPYRVIKIGANAFRGCDNLTSITIPEGVTSIGESAFSNCSSLTSITIPESVTEIGSNAFYGCNGLTAVHISSLEDWCKISFGDSDANPLAYAHNLYLNGELVTELVIPEGITEIGGGAFYECSSLTSITIPEGVTSIGESAFFNCCSLTSITIPEGVTSIGSDAFSGCI